MLTDYIFHKNRQTGKKTPRLFPCPCVCRPGRKHRFPPRKRHCPFPDARKPDTQPSLPHLQARSPAAKAGRKTVRITLNTGKSISDDTRIIKRESTCYRMIVGFGRAGYTGYIDKENEQNIFPFLTDRANTDRLCIFIKTDTQVKRRPDFFLAPVFVVPAGNTVSRHENDTVRLSIPGNRIHKHRYRIF